jgi:hypothetical protein
MIQIKDSGRLRRPLCNPVGKENPSMRPVRKSFVGAVVAALTVSGGAMAQQSYYDDMACRQYADAQIAPMRDQANANAVGGALLGAGLGAALGAAVGGGRGAGIGAASGAIVGTGVGAANAQNADAYLQQQFNAYYGQCMAARTAPPPPRAYAPAPAYAQPGYAPAPGGSSASQLNQQQLNQTQAPPPGYYPPPPR